MASKLGLLIISTRLPKGARVWRRGTARDGMIPDGVGG